MRRRTTGIHDLYARDPLKADSCLWGRRSDPVTRRGFLGGAGLAAMSTALGSRIPFASLMPAGLIPAALAEDGSPFEIEGKEGLLVHNDRPLNMETPAHLLDDPVTPASRMFVRNNGIPPQLGSAPVDEWTLDIGGEACERPQSFTLADLKARFTHHTYQLQLGCGGNGRKEFHPPAAGNQWSTGAIACPRWTGVRLRDVLNACGVGDNAVYTAYYGADGHLSGDPGKHPISRGTTIAKALEEESLIAWALNGEPLPPLHGFPLRLVTGGWPASTSGKWLRRIDIRDRVHDGAKMTGSSYRVPCRPVAPGEKVDPTDMCIIESMPVKSLVTFPRSGIQHDMREDLEVRGHAWAGDDSVKQVFVSMDFGATWRSAELEPPANRLAWQQWSARLEFATTGYYEVWARAVDSRDRSQPMLLPAWNPKGYLNNACHRIAVKVV
ncbi:MAG: sulfite oxidase [Pseudomonadota bacterium]